MTVETLDKFYLEWSQFTKARNQREIRAHLLIEHAIQNIDELGNSAPGAVVDARKKLLDAYRILGEGEAEEVS